ncbi:MAG: helix-hairpin-helix domain-containing protein, partial [Clostridia bacterium]|nr:helix-hairpin-helix domain-containing protein [Clostridia bacterium]
EQLVKLKGIGEKMSERIIKYRQENGPFMSIEEIMKVSGISEKKFEDIKEYISVE